MTKILIGVVVTLVLLLFIREGCNGNDKAQLEKQLADNKAALDYAIAHPKIDTVKITDSFEVITVPIVAYIDTGSTRRIYKDTGRIVYRDTAGMVKDYNNIYSYIDSVKSKYGPIIIRDLVQHNAIKSRKVETLFTIPEITKTVTVKETPPLKAQWYLGGKLMGNKNTMGGGLEIMLLDKKNRAFEAGGYRIGKEFFAGVGLKINL